MGRPKVLVAGCCGKKQAKKQIKKKAPGLSVANAERVGGKTASELETPSAYAEQRQRGSSPVRTRS